MYGSKDVLSLLLKARPELGGIVPAQQQFSILDGGNTRRSKTKEMDFSGRE